jgi:hypothetical protein
MFFKEMEYLAIIWKTIGGEKIYKTPSGWPLTRKARELADKFDKILCREIKKISKQLQQEGYFGMKPGLPKYYLLGKSLQFVKDLKYRSICDPDIENIWRAFYDYAPKLAQRKMPKTDERSIGKRNFFLMCYRLGQLSNETVEKLGTWTNYEDVYMVFAASPHLWKDWARLLNWIISKSEEEGKINREMLRKTLKAFRKILGKKSRFKRETTVLSDAELTMLLNSAVNSLHSNNIT